MITTTASMSTRTRTDRRPSADVRGAARVEGPSFSRIFVNASAAYCREGMDFFIR
jgi:hypothetical protein